MFSLSKQTSYALIIIHQLQGKKEFTPLSSLAEKTNMPKRFIARTASELANHNILLSKEGKNGGYKLKKNPKDIKLLDFLKIFEEDLSLVCCQNNDNFKCECEAYCQHKDFFSNKLSEILIKQLEKYTLADTFSNNLKIKNAKNHE